MGSGLVELRQNPALVTDALPDSSTFALTVTLFDGSDVKVQMYVGNRKIDLKSIDDDMNCFWDMSFNLTQY